MTRVPYTRPEWTLDPVLVSLRMAGAAARTFCLVSVAFVWLGFITVDHYIDPVDLPTALHAALLSTGALLLASLGLGQDVTRSLHRWLFVASLFLGYIVEFFWFIADPASAQDAALTVPFGSHDLVRGFWHASVALAAGTLVFALFAIRPQRATDRRTPGAAPPIPRMSADRVYWACLATSAPLAAIGLAAAVVFRVGVVGYEQNLPYRLGGVFHYMNRAAVPGLLLTAIAASTWCGSVRRRNWALAFMLAFAVADGVITTSRGAFIQVGIRYAFILMLTGAFTRRTVHLLAVLALLGVLSFPLLSRLREARAGGTVSISEALEKTMAESMGPSTVMETVRPLATRFTGLNVLAPILRAEARLPPGDVLAGFLGGEGASKYTTHYVFGFDADAPVGIAPSTLGWLYISAGEGGILWGAAILALLLELAWRGTCALRLHARPVLQCLLAGVMFGALTEGTWDAVAMHLAAPLATVAMLELLIRLCARAGSAGVAAGGGQVTCS